jgi:hypothetical protein
MKRKPAHPAQLPNILLLIVIYGDMVLCQVEKKIALENS